MNVYTTYDYDKFILHEGNRGIDRKTVNRLKRMIESKGYIGSPILVNGKMEIMDGQHRFVACKELGLPIEYFVRDSLTIGDVPDINKGRAWTTKTFVEVGAKQRNKSYERLADLLALYGRGTQLEGMLAVIREVRDGITKTNNYVLNTEIKNGTLNISEDVYIRANAIMASCVKLGIFDITTTKGIKLHKREFWSAIAFVYNEREKLNVDIKAFAKAICQNQFDLPNANDTCTYLRAFELFYNAGRRNKVQFEAVFKLRGIK